MPAVIVLILEFLILTLFKSIGTTDVGNVFAGVLIFVHVLALVQTFSKSKNLRKYSRSLTIALLFRIVLMLIDLYAYPRFVLPNGHSDEDMLFANAAQYAVDGRTNRGYFTIIMGILFRFIGFNRLYGQYVSMICSIVALICLCEALSQLDLSDSVKCKVVKIVCLLPNFAILSSLFMKEAMANMFFSLSVYYFIKWTKEKQEKYYIFAAALTFPAAMIHSGFIAALIGYIAIRMIYDNRKETIHITFANVMVTLVIAFAAVYVLNNTGSTFLSKFGSLDSLEDIANMRGGARSSYLQYVGNSNNPVNLIIYTPLRIFFFLFSPLPWMWRGVADIIAFFFSSLYYLVVIWNAIKFLSKGSKEKSKNRVLTEILLIVAIAIILVFAWGTNNAGTASRHRDKTVVLFGILWALSLDGLQSNRVLGSVRGSYRRRRI